MNNKDKIAKLSKYLSLLLNRLESPTSKKHEEHPVELKQFLNREIEGVKSKLDSLKVQ